MRAPSPVLLRIVTVVVLTGSGLLPSFAEVGVVHVSPADEPFGPYIVSAIVDDPDPTRNDWAPVHVGSEHHAVLNPDGGSSGDGPPSIAINPVSRLPLVAWARNSASGFDVVVSQYTGGAWTPPTVVAASSANDLDPFVTIDPADGSTHVVYWVDDPARVMMVEAPADLSSWSQPIPVSSPGEIALRPAAVLHEGQLRVTYEVHNLQRGGIPRQIVLATQEGTGFSSEVVASSSYSAPAWPQVHSAAGKLWVEWIDQIDAMAWTARQEDLSWGPLSLEAFDGLEDRDFFTRGRIKDQALEPN